MRKIFTTICNNYFIVKCLLKFYIARVIVLNNCIEFNATLEEAKTTRLNLPCSISICMFQYEYFAFFSFVLYLMLFCNRFVFKCFVPNIQLPLKKRCYYVVDFTALGYFTVINSITRVLLFETLHKIRTIKF